MRKMSPMLRNKRFYYTFPVLSCAVSAALMVSAESLAQQHHTMVERVTVVDDSGNLVGSMIYTFVGATRDRTYQARSGWWDRTPIPCSANTSMQADPISPNYFDSSIIDCYERNIMELKVRRKTVARNLAANALRAVRANNAGVAAHALIELSANSNFTASDVGWYAPAIGFDSERGGFSDNGGSSSFAGNVPGDDEMSEENVDTLHDTLAGILGISFAAEALNILPRGTTSFTQFAELNRNVDGSTYLRNIAIMAIAKALDIPDGFSFDRTRSTFLMTQNLRDALKAYQRESGLAQTAELNDETLAALSGVRTSDLLQEEWLEYGSPN